MSSSVKLDDLDLVKKVPESTTLLDLRSVYSLNVIDKRKIVELEVIGSAGSVLQDMGCEPVKISVVGEMMGPESKNYIESMINKFNNNKPVEFASDLSSISEISKVIIENLLIQEVAGSPNRYKYHLSLKEHTENNGTQNVQQPSQVQAAAQEIANAIDNI